MDLKKVIFEIKDSIAFITINNVEKRNAMGVDVCAELIWCVKQCAVNDEVRVAVIRGAGGNFCAGGDVKSMKSSIETGVVDMSALRDLNDLLVRFKNLKIPTIAMVEGAAAGAGISLALSCDFSYAAEDAKFVYAFVNIGLIPDMGSTYLTTRAVGTVKAAELFMMGRPFSGADARDWGLITDAVSADQLEQTVMKLANRLAKGPTKSYGYIKTMINRASFSGIETSLDNEVEYQENCKRSEDHKEGVTAFFEKRKPEFKGK